MVSRTVAEGADCRPCRDVRLLLPHIRRHYLWRDSDVSDKIASIIIAQKMRKGLGVTRAYSRPYLSLLFRVY
eukprot:6184605-Pleurochrysis_carterae.AAC.3